MGLSRDQEKAMFAGSGKSGKGIRKKQITKTKVPIVKGHRFKKNNRNLGIGAEVVLVKPFGINDIPVGTKGVVVSHNFGRDRPTVKFFGVDASHRIIDNPDILEIKKVSTKYDPVNYEKIKVYGSSQELQDQLRTSQYFMAMHDYNDGYLYGTEYLDDGEGHTADVPYQIHVKDNEVDVKLNKKDIPNRWQYAYDNIKEEIIEKVRDALGIRD